MVGVLSHTAGALALLLFASALPAGAAQQCGTAASLPAIAAAIAHIEASSDPCGETAELRTVVERFRRCAADAVLCIDSQAQRNLTESRVGAHTPTTITWNPDLRTPLEPHCAATAGPLLRDPTASLLHELVHAVQDCDGLELAAHELDAVRIENIYRRAQGLCQRTGYGELPLPAARRVRCAPGDCPCIPGDRDHPVRTLQAAASPRSGSQQVAGDR